MKAVTILGTRPEFVKLSDFIPLMDDWVDHFIIHTGQHYDYKMDEIFFKELSIRQPDLNLNVGSHSHAKQTALMLEPIEKFILEKNPDCVISLGDTNSTLAAALVASKLQIPFVHLEAGCRSFTPIPEEINRVIADHVADVLIAPTKTCVGYLRREGIKEDKIFNVGDFVFDAVKRNVQLSDFSTIASELGLGIDNYVIVTIHRAEHTDDKIVLSNIFKALDRIAEKIDVVYPMHPRTKKSAEGFSLKLKKVKVVEPLGYLDMLALLGNAKLAITDSGGVQKEALALNTPCLITRTETEWVEGVNAKKNFLVGNSTEGIVKKAFEFLDDKRYLEGVRNVPFQFDTDVSKKTVEIIFKKFNSN